jgi:hypothetical protein
MDSQFLAASLTWNPIVNMSRKEDGEPLTANPNAFLSDEVTREFGADWGETAAFVPEAKIGRVRCRTRECRSSERDVEGCLVCLSL